MGWVHAGTDDKIEFPDIFGCVSLPTPAQCFGNSFKTYGSHEKEELLSILTNVVKQTRPWPDSLKGCFSKENSSLKQILGSPMVDASLGMPISMKKVIAELDANNHIPKKSLADQYDQMLPPETPSHWIQCELCKQWRRVRWDIDEEVLSAAGDWMCSMNYWNPDSASCSAPKDEYDSDNEGAVAMEGGDGSANLDQYVINTWRDVYCIKNLVFYEAKIVAVKPPTNENELGKVKFHFKGWNSNLDEWIDAGSPRIAPHNTCAITVKDKKTLLPKDISARKSTEKDNSRRSKGKKIIKIKHKSIKSKQHSYNSNIENNENASHEAASTFKNGFFIARPIQFLGQSNENDEDIDLNNNEENTNGFAKRRRKSNNKFFQDFMA